MSADTKESMVGLTSHGMSVALLLGQLLAGISGRVQWLEGPPGQPPAVAGTDFIVARDGRIATVYLFFDKLP